MPGSTVPMSVLHHDSLILQSEHWHRVASTINECVRTILSNDANWDLRVDLAAAFRIAAHFDWHESVANHFSVTVPGDGDRFLINPAGRHFSLIKASDLLLLDMADESAPQGAAAPDPTAWHLHSNMHRIVPQARCILHLHPPYATALSALADPSIIPIDQTSARFYNRVSIDAVYGGMADEDSEAQRIVRSLGDNSVLILRNHGIMVIGDSVGDAFDTLYHVERACRTIMIAYSSGQPIARIADDVAEKTARAWEKYKPDGLVHFEEMKKVVLGIDGSYRE